MNVYGSERVSVVACEILQAPQVIQAPTGRQHQPCLQRQGNMIQHKRQALKGRKSKPDKMPQSLVKNYIHLVYSTKHRQHLLDEAIQPDLFSYIGGICSRLECYPVKVGGHTNHVHVLFLLSKKKALMDVVEEIKSHASKWIKTKGREYGNVYWQNGYGAFSVNPSEVDTVVAYIENQRDHHKKKTFEDEYRAFLKKYNVAYDERYVWD